MTIALQIAGYWFAASVAFCAAYAFIRSRQKRHAEIMRRLDFEAYQLERARHYHIVCDYQRIGAI